MPIADNLQWYLRPQAGDTTIHNEVGSGEVLTGSGETLVESGGVYGWRIANGSFTGACPSFSILTSNDAGGATFAVDIEVVTYSTASPYASLISAHPSGSAVQTGLQLTQNTTNSLRLRYNEALPLANTAGAARKTYVYKLNAFASTGDFGELWVGQTGRSGDAPDATSGVANAGSRTISAITLGVADATIIIRGYAVWSRELTDAECAQVADNGIVATISGGGGTTISCNLGLSSATGYAASILAATTIACALGSADAIGYQATIQTGSNTTIACALGTASAVGYQATVTVSGSATITSPVFKNNTGTVLSGLTVPNVWAIPLGTPNFSNLVTDGSGVLTITSGTLSAGDYLLVTAAADGTIGGVSKVTAV